MRGSPRDRLKSKGARTGCVKKPGGKKLPACGVNLILQRLESKATSKPVGRFGILTHDSLSGEGRVSVALLESGETLSWLWRVIGRYPPSSKTMVG